MLCLGRYTHLPELFIDLAHITANALAKSTKIVIVQLLTLWRHSTKQGTAGIDQILSLEIFIAVDQEIFLLSMSLLRSMPRLMSLQTITRL